MVKIQFLVGVLLIGVASYAETANVKITSGVPADEHEFPYLVSIQTEEPLNTKHMCGGVIIEEKYIATAAQCVQVPHPSNLQIIAGEHELYKSSGREQVINAHSVKTHSKYDPETMHNDIAIIQLERALNFNNEVSAIDIAEDEVPAGTQCTVAGWGATKQSGSTEHTLRKTTVKTITDDSCKSILSGYSINYFMLCAGDGTKGVCFEDEGGPLVCNGELHGLVSFSDGCGVSGSPGVYTEMNLYTNWINNAISYLNDLYDQPLNATTQAPI